MATVLVIGSGGREHALATGLAASPAVERVVVSPGNDGMLDVATCHPGRNAAEWRALADELDADLVVIGPEVPLVDGVADHLRAAGRTVFGPGAAGARLEGDKAYAKEFLVAAGIPTAEAQTFDQAAAALAYVESRGGDCVVKATGLAAGKGVSVCTSMDEARAAIHTIMEERAFGNAGAQVLIEERLAGPELSVFAVCDGQRLAWFTPSRDHKRLLDDDRGPNTGGMGAFTPVPGIDADFLADVEARVLRPTVDELLRRDVEFRGLLYVGLMLTPEGPKVLEYNVRFGDPETQVVIPAFDGDLYAVLHGAASGRLPASGALPSRGAAVGVVLAADGYPQSPRKGDAIEGLPPAEPGRHVFHAGTARTDGVWTTRGGRVVCVVAVEPEVAAARDAAYAMCDQIRFPGRQLRRDIAASA